MILLGFSETPVAPLAPYTNGEATCAKNVAQKNTLGWQYFMWSGEIFPGNFLPNTVPNPKEMIPGLKQGARVPIGL